MTRLTDDDIAATTTPEHVETLPADDWHPFPYQVPPPGEWDVWLLLGGRGSGKTRTGAQYVLEHLRQYGPRARVGVGGPTIADARDVCAEGESGLITIARSEFRYNRSLGEAFHKDGGYVKFLGSEEPARWNGPQWSLLWVDELALWNEESFDQAQFGLRLGEYPRVIATTTPKSRKFVRELSLLPTTATVRASTYDNTTLPAATLRRFEERYGGTTLGRQELLAEWVDDVEGAMWRRSWIEGARLSDIPDGVRLSRLVVGIDPAFSTKDEACETGMCVAAIGSDRHFYVLDSIGMRATPQGWAQAAIGLYHQWSADSLVVETNFGGEMVKDTIRKVSPSIPVQEVHASRGKAIRAEPVSALYEQGKVHHVGLFSTVEDQMCAFPVEKDQVVDRLDALVWALTKLGGLSPTVSRHASRPLVIGGTGRQSAVGPDGRMRR